MAEKYCLTCRKKRKCKVTCKKVEVLLGKLNHSLKSNYIIKFFDPQFIENFEVEQVEEEVYAGPPDSPVLVDVIRKSLRVLNKYERYYIIRHYGLKDNEPLTQTALAEKKKVSQHTVYYHLKRARKKILDYLWKNYENI